MVCLRAEDNDDDDGSVGRLRRSKGLSDDDRGIGRGRGVCDASEGSETITEVVGAR